MPSFAYINWSIVASFCVHIGILLALFAYIHWHILSSISTHVVLHCWLQLRTHWHIIGTICVHALAHHWHYLCTCIRILLAQFVYALAHWWHYLCTHWHIVGSICVRTGTLLAVFTHMPRCIDRSVAQIIMNAASQSYILEVWNLLHTVYVLQIVLTLYVQKAMVNYWT